MKFFRKGISAIVLSSKLLLALGVGLPLCSFQNIYAGPEKELKDLSLKKQFSTQDVENAIALLKQNCVPAAQTSYLEILKKIHLNMQSYTTLAELNVVRNAFQAANETVQILQKSDHGKTQPFYLNAKFIADGITEIDAKIASLSVIN